MNATEIGDLYQRIMEEPGGCAFIRMDLHVHTPRSKCYARTPLLDEQAEYLAILDKAIATGIQILAITDHNTFEGYKKLRQILDTLKKKDYHRYRDKKYGQLYILPGIEISNFGKHFLAIFAPESFKSAPMDSFLHEIGIELEGQGEKNAEAYRVTPVVLLEKIHALGGLAIIPHADSPSGFLREYFDANEKDNKLRGKSIATILKSPHLSAISFSNDGGEAKFQRLISNKEYLREKPLAVIQCSDYHGMGDGKKTVSGSPLGEKFSVIKITQPSFHGIKMALEDPQTRIMDQEPSIGHPYILGVAVQGVFFGDQPGVWKCFRFNPWLNCLIGARGTGKSTLLNILQFALYGKREKDNDGFLNLFDKAVVFANVGTSIFAIGVAPRTIMDAYTGARDEVLENRKIYALHQSQKFVSLKNSRDKLSEKFKVFLTASSYQQAELYNMGKDLLGPVAIIDHLIQISNIGKYRGIMDDIKILTGSLQNLSDEFRKEKQQFNSTNVELRDQISQSYYKLLEAYNALRDLRAAVVEQINHVLAGQVELSLIRHFPPKWIKEKAEYWTGTGIDIEYSPYNERREIISIIERVFRSPKWVLPLALFLHDPSLLADNTPGISLGEAKKLFNSPSIRYMRKDDPWSIFPHDVVDFKYNTAGGRIKPSFVERGKLSLGQNTVALLLIILTAGRSLLDTRPLLMDQPEDHLDNQYIYTELVQEIRNSKKMRQMVLSTHNPNIPIAGDAEQIFILEASETEGIRISATGSVDSEKISGKVMDILEGGAEALALRASKYPRFLQKLPQ